MGGFRTCICEFATLASSFRIHFYAAGWEAVILMSSNYTGYVGTVTHL